MLKNFGDKRNTAGFDKHPENIGDGRPLGLKNRATIAKDIFSIKIKYPEEILQVLKTMYPDIKNVVTIEEAITLVQAAKAVLDKDTAAYRALMDSAYGSPQQTLQASIGTSKKDISDIFPTEEELNEEKKDK